MKILVISALYPPYHLGGYEIRCKDIIDELANRGHEILVLTSQKGNRKEGLAHQTTQYQVSRTLIVRIRTGSIIDQLTRWRTTHILGMLLAFARELFFDLRDMAFIERQVKQFQPDVIYLGHITNLSKGIMPLFAECAIPIVFDEGGSGLIDSWVERGIWHKFTDEYVSRYSILNSVNTFTVKLVCKISANRIKAQWGWPDEMQIMFNSDLNRRNAIASGVPVDGAVVIHSGIDTELFSFKSKTKLGSSLSIIVPGRIESRKGQIDAVRLLARLRECDIQGDLIIVGKNWSISYYAEIEDEINRLGLEVEISLLPMMPHEKLIDQYHKADICFFPSYFKTGFSRVPLEAMACGCILISYGNEGSNEIIRDQLTGFLVPPGDYDGMVDLINRLIANPKMVAVMVMESRKEIEQHHSMGKYVDLIEELIINATRAH